MSTMTLNLPINYVDVDRDEMEYVDGGYTSSQHWWGFAYTLSESETVRAVRALVLIAAGATAAIFFSLGVGLPLGAITVCCGVSAATLDFIDSLGNNQGVTICVSKVGASWISHN